MTRAEQLVAAVEQAHFPYLNSLIHLFVGRSELHGSKVKNTDDLDIYGIYLEPPALVLGLDKQDFYKRQLWTYSGLGLETRDSGEYHYVQGQVRRAAKSRCPFAA